MKKLLMLAFAAMALAIPASASAEALDGSRFKHEGNLVLGSTEVFVTGTAGFTSAGNTVHCPTINAVVDLDAKGTGTATSFSCIGGKLNGVLDVHAAAVGIHNWIVESRKAGGQIVIRNLTIHNVFTSGGSPVGTSTLAGTVRAKLLGNPLFTNTGELFNEAGELTSNGAAASVFGHLSFTNKAGAKTNIGVE